MFSIANRFSIPMSQAIPTISCTIKSDPEGLRYVRGTETVYLRDWRDAHQMAGQAKEQGSISKSVFWLSVKV